MRERGREFVTLHALAPDTDPEKKPLQEFKGSGSFSDGKEKKSGPEGEKVITKKVDELTLEDLFRLGDSGNKFKQIILEGVADRTDGPKVGLSELTQDFNFVVARLASENPGKSIKDILAFGNEKLYKHISQIITPPEKKRTEPKEPSAAEKRELSQALFMLKHDIEKFARERKIPIGTSGAVVSAAKNLAKGVFGQSKRAAERERTKKEIDQSLLFLNSLQESGRLSEQALAHNIYIRDPKEKNAKSNNFILGSLDFAFKYNVGYTPNLERYVKQFKEPEPTAADVMPDRIITALRYISEGYGAEPFNEEKSLQQWQTGTQFSAGGKGAGNYLTRGFVKSVDVKGS